MERQEAARYGVTVGLDLGYTLPFGLRISAQIGHGFGRRLEETSSTGEVNFGKRSPEP